MPNRVIEPLREGVPQTTEELRKFLTALPDGLFAAIIFQPGPVEGSMRAYVVGRAPPTSDPDAASFVMGTALGTYQFYKEAYSDDLFEAAERAYESNQESLVTKEVDDPDPQPVPQTAREKAIADFLSDSPAKGRA